MENKNSFFDSPLSSGFLQALQNAIHAHGGQAAVAKAAGMAQGNISKILKGRDVRVSTLGRLLAALGGGLAVVGDERTSIVRETPAEFQLEMQRAKEKLIDSEREALACARAATDAREALLTQHRDILDAVKITCRDLGISGETAYLLQNAVMNYHDVKNGTAKVGFLSPDCRHAVSE